MPRASKGEQEKRRRKVAKGIVAGKKPRQIAKEARCTTRHVERLASEPETQFLITAAMRPHRRKLEKLAEKAITAVSVALGAKSTDKQNHFIRLKAVERYSDLLELAQGTADETEGGAGLVTWEEFVVLYRSRKEPSDRSEQHPHQAV